MSQPDKTLSDSQPPSRPSGALKQVTMVPGSLSMSDADLAQFGLEPGSGPVRKDPYVGYLIDGRYRVDSVLGEGGMGVVYRCTHKIIGKKVAMKVLRADMARDAEVTERFLNEARSASAIGNPHIIDISDFGQLPDGSTYFVMEFLEGIPLAKVVEGGQPLPVARILHIARQLAEGLAAAHDAGIVHRDLKPDNIFLVGRGTERDFVKILDFGIAKVSSAGEKLTRAGQVFGTPHYMSPEQAAGAPIDHRCDIYSFGVILYELASGKVPFDADNFMGILTQHMYKAPVPIRALVPEPQDVPPGLEAIILKCLSKRPEQRYESMRALLEDLEKLGQGVVPDAVGEMMQRSGGFNVPSDYFKAAAPAAQVPATPGPRGERSRWPLVAGIAGAAVAVALVIGIFAKSASSDAAPTAAATPVEPPAPLPEPKVEAPPPPVAAKAKKQVVLAVAPLDARVYRGEQDLGTSPVVVEVSEGETVALEIRREGYRTETLTLDGKDAKRSVKLEKEKAGPVAVGGAVRKPAPGAKPEPVPAAQDTPKPKPKPSPGLGGGEIVDPWK